MYSEKIWVDVGATLDDAGEEATLVQNPTSTNDPGVDNTVGLDVPKFRNIQHLHSCANASLLCTVQYQDQGNKPQEVLSFYTAITQLYWQLVQTDTRLGFDRWGRR